jgi:hypothetical protein
MPAALEATMNRPEFSPTLFPSSRQQNSGNGPELHLKEDLKEVEKKYQNFVWAFERPGILNSCELFTSPWASGAATGCFGFPTPKQFS